MLIGVHVVHQIGVNIRIKANHDNTALSSFFQHGLEAGSGSGDADNRVVALAHHVADLIDLRLHIVTGAGRIRLGEDALLHLIGGIGIKDVYECGTPRIAYIGVAESDLITATLAVAGTGSLGVRGCTAGAGTAAAGGQRQHQ